MALVKRTDAVIIYERRQRDGMAILMVTYHPLLRARIAPTIHCKGNGMLKTDKAARSRRLEKVSAAPGSVEYS
jgi:hypothetical protein